MSGSSKRKSNQIGGIIKHISLKGPKRSPCLLDGVHALVSSSPHVAFSDLLKQTKRMLLVLDRAHGLYTEADDDNKVKVQLLKQQSLLWLACFAHSLTCKK